MIEPYETITINTWTSSWFCFLIKNFTFLFVYLACMWVDICLPCVGRSENSLQDSAISLYRMCSGDQACVVRLGDSASTCCAILPAPNSFCTVL